MPAAPAARPRSSRPGSRIASSQIAEGDPEFEPPEAAQKWEAAFRAKEGVGLFYPRAVNEMRMLAKAIKEAKSDDPKAIAPQLEGMKTERLRRRRNLHAQGRPPALPGHLHRAASARSSPAPSSTRKAPAGAGRRSASSRPSDTVLPTTCKMERP